MSNEVRLKTWRTFLETLPEYFTLFRMLVPQRMRCATIHTRPFKVLLLKRCSLYELTDDDCS